MRPKIFTHSWNHVEPYRLAQKKYIVCLRPGQLPSIILRQEFIFEKIVKKPPLFEEFIREFESDWFLTGGGRGRGRGRGGGGGGRGDGGDGDDGDDKYKYYDKFYVSLDLPYFKPEDISVKVMGDIVIVEGKISQKGKYDIILNTNILEISFHGTIRMNCII